MTSMFTSLLGMTTTAPPPNSWWDTIVQGGMVGFIILALSIVALVLVIIHFVQIRKVLHYTFVAEGIESKLRYGSFRWIDLIAAHASEEKLYLGRHFLQNAIVAKRQQFIQSFQDFFGKVCNRH